MLYVGWTRARDKVVLAGRQDFLQKGILRLLEQDGEHLLNDPQDNIADWAGNQIEVTERIGESSAPVSRPVKLGFGYKKRVKKEYQPAFVSASSLQVVGEIGPVEEIGKRIQLSGSPHMQFLGEAVHTFLGADNVKMVIDDRINCATKVLNRWGVGEHLEAVALVSASTSLYSWVNQKWPGAVWHCEYPVALKRKNGTIVSGVIDLLLETTKGFVIIDHKSFPGSVEDAQMKAAGFAGQLGVYAEAVEKATGRDLIGSYIHLPIIGLAMEVQAG